MSGIFLLWGLTRYRRELDSATVSTRPERLLTPSEIRCDLKKLDRGGSASDCFLHGQAPETLKETGDSKMKVRPLNDRILVKRLAEETKTAGGLFIPDSAKEKPSRGEIIAVGNGKLDDSGKRVPLEVKAGEKILFGKYAGTEIKLEGEEHIILREDDVLAVIEG